MGQNTSGWNMHRLRIAQPACAGSFPPGLGSFERAKFTQRTGADTVTYTVGELALDHSTETRSAATSPATSNSKLPEGS